MNARRNRQAKREEFRLQRAHLPGPKAVVIAAAGLVAATLALSHAAASIGVGIYLFRPLGASFFSTRAAELRLSTLATTSKSNGVKRDLQTYGEAILAHSPMSTRALWYIGVAREAQGDANAARRSLRLAESLSRREGTVQLWLGQDALKSGRLTDGLRHFDTLLKTIPRLRSEVLPSLAMAAMEPEGRQALVPYMVRSNEWLSNFLVVAVDRMPRVTPLAQLLVQKEVELPNDAMGRSAYGTLTRRLAAESSYNLLARLYPKLPGAAPAVLTGLDVPALTGTTLQGYAPVVWDFGTSSDLGGVPTAIAGGTTGIEFYAAGGTVGTVGSKLVLRRNAVVMRWAIDDRQVNNGASARWVATCVSAAGDGASTISADLAAELPLNRRLSLTFPAGCPMIRVDMRFAGGTGRDPSTIVVRDLALVGPGPGAVN